jgi:NCAIR mutase (PurE)-related protein
MTELKIRQLLEQVAAGRVSTNQALQRLRYLPFEDLGFARIDNHRSLRRNVPEVVFGAGKGVQQIVKIGQRMAAAGANLMVTRLDPLKASAVKRKLRAFEYRPEARVGLMMREKPTPSGHGAILVITAGTSDIPVAEEAAVCAQFFGNRIERLYDVGVAGLHRLTSQLEMLHAASVIIVVAGMEGALPSVVAGLVGKPVIGVPTSVGYGAAFGGIAPLLGMLNSCAGGLTVVNIDNGFGAALAATLINRVGLAQHQVESPVHRAELGARLRKRVEEPALTSTQQRMDSHGRINRAVNPYPTPPPVRGREPIQTSAGNQSKRGKSMGVPERKRNG